LDPTLVLVADAAEIRIARRPTSGNRARLNSFSRFVV
jgi:hypothetical protein